MDLLKSISPLIDDLYLKLKPENHILYSSTGKEINERTAYVALNTILKDFGDKYGIKLLTHSFRIGYITKLLKYYNVQVAKSIIGHKDIASTIRYDRNLLNSNDVKELLNRINNS
jgi:site-specific recombinase XerD